ncbi:MAG: thioredoxin family protein [Bacillota bacterium]
MVINKADTKLFEEAISNNEGCLVMFSRKGCHVCEEVLPRVEEIANAMADFSFYYVDAEEEKDLLKKFNLKGVPQLLFFKDGEFYGKLAGNVEEEEIKEKINELL